MSLSLSWQCLQLGYATRVVWNSIHTCSLWLELVHIIPTCARKQLNFLCKTQTVNSLLWLSHLCREAVAATVNVTADSCKYTTMVSPFGRHASQSQHEWPNMKPKLTKRLRPFKRVHLEHKNVTSYRKWQGCMLISVMLKILLFSGMPLNWRSHYGRIQTASNMHHSQKKKLYVLLHPMHTYMHA